jgi:arylsulfatase A-like enzyme
VVFIITDQERYDSLGCTGNPHAVTPNIDRLAAEGTVFDRFITTSAICSPSRAGMFTGLQCSMHGLWTNGVALPRSEHVQVTQGSLKAFPGKWVASNIPTFADCFRAEGYHTASVGKLHFTPTSAHESCAYAESGAYWRTNPAMRDWHGPYYGIEDVWLTLGHGERISGHYGVWLRENHPEVMRAVDSSAKTRALEFPECPQLYPSEIPPELHNSTWIGDNACRIISESAGSDQPLCLWVGFPDPHSPFVPPKQLAEEFSSHDVLGPKVPPGEHADKPFALRNLMNKRKACESSPECIRRYWQYTDAMMNLIDTNVGKVLDTIRDAGMWDNTVIVYTSDHGDFLGDYGMHGKCVPCCRSLNHVPLIIRAPGLEWPDRVGTTASGADICPTLCDLAAVAPPEHQHGEPIRNIVETGRREHLAMVQHYTPTLARQNISVYDERFRFTWYPISGELELYDHREDPFEVVNVAGDDRYRADVDRLMRQLQELQCLTCSPRAGRVAVW